MADGGDAEGKGGWTCVYHENASASGHMVVQKECQPNPSPMRGIILAGSAFPVVAVIELLCDRR